MGKYTEIKKIKDTEAFIDYRISDSDMTPVMFFIRITKPQKIIKCSIYENMSDPFYELDCSDPNYNNTQLSQSVVSQRVFVRGLMKIVTALENNKLLDDLSICN
jgi:hypothetical protein